MQRVRKHLARLSVAIQILVLCSGASLGYMGNQASADDPTVPVTGKVTDLNGDALGDVRVYATLPGQTDQLASTATSQPQQDVHIGIDGAYTLAVPAGTYNIYFDPTSDPSWAGALKVVHNVTVAGPVTLNEQLITGNSYSVSGTVRTAQGSPVANEGISASTHSGTDVTVSSMTDANGHYAMTLSPNSYAFGVLNNTVTPGLPQNYYYQQQLAVSGSTTSHDITLPNTLTATLTVKDLQGNPAVNVPVTFGGSSGTNDYLLMQGSEANTNSQGVATLHLLRSSYVSGVQWCGSFYADNIKTCLAPAPSSIDMTGSSISYELDETAVPGNDDTNGLDGHHYNTYPVSDLTVSITAGKPVLNWTSQEPQNHQIDIYSVVRDGAQVLGGVYTGDFPTTSLSFTDVTALPGTHTYTLVPSEDGSPFEALSSLPVSVTVPSPIVAPVVGVTSPAANATLSGTVALNGNLAVNPNATSYNYMLYVFNSSSQAVVAKYSYAVPASQTTQSYSWDTTQVPNGNYTVTISAKDNLGNKDAGSSQSVHVTVHN